MRGRRWAPRCISSRRGSRFGVVTVALAGLLAAAVAQGCSKKAPSPKKTVVVYTSLDQIYSDPILSDFERRTGIEVRPVYDTEAAKTTGLINRLIARRDQPDCDVLWNNEVLQTERLGQMGLLSEYVSPEAKRFPERFRDERGRWTGFAGRMRVIIYNKRLVKRDELRGGVDDLISPRWRGRTAIARPFFGTTLTHMAVLHQRWGPERLSAYLDALRANDTALCLGNATVRDMVATGERAFGLTDTDDAHAAVLDGKPVGIIVPDADGGPLVIPNTVALIANCPHPEAGKKLIDYLLSAEVERRLARGRSAQIPLATDLADVKTPWDDLTRRGDAMVFDVTEAAASIPAVVELLRKSRMDR